MAWPVWLGANPSSGGKPSLATTSGGAGVLPPEEEEEGGGGGDGGVANDEEEHKCKRRKNAEEEECGPFDRLSEKEEGRVARDGRVRGITSPFLEGGARVGEGGLVVHIDVSAYPPGWW